MSSVPARLQTWQKAQLENVTILDPDCVASTPTSAASSAPVELEPSDSFSSAESPVNGTQAVPKPTINVHEASDAEDSDGASRGAQSLASLRAPPVISCSTQIFMIHADIGILDSEGPESKAKFCKEEFGWSERCRIERWWSKYRGT